jgi:tRNA-splicing endonuclease subunit Sen54
VPTLPQLHALLAATPPDPPPKEASLYHKLKHGYRNVVLAIVDQGVTSYIRVADAAFGQEKVYERIGKAPMRKNSGRGKKNTRRG